MLRGLLSAAALVAGILLSPAAFACEGGKVLMEDNFSKLNRAWGVAIDPKLERVDGEGLSTDYPPGTVKRAISQWGFFDNAVACATYSVTYNCTEADRCETQPYVGLIVWGVDLENYYAFEVAPLVGFELAAAQTGRAKTQLNLSRFEVREMAPESQ